MTRAVTSASNLFRRALCPGSARMEAGIVETDSEYSAEGTMLHRVMKERALGVIAENAHALLTDEQSSVLATAERLCRDFFDLAAAAFDVPGGNTHEEFEATLSFKDADGVELFPGHTDRLRRYVGHNVLAIADYKFGFADVDEAVENLQLATYAVMKWQELRKDGGLPWRIAVAIIQPRNFGQKLTTAIYDQQGLDSAEREILRIYAESQKPDAPLIAGEKQCDKCKAKLFCPAYRERFMAVQTLGERAIDKLNNEELIAFHVACSFAAKIKKEVSAEMRVRINAGRLPGWKLKNNGSERTVTDAGSLFTAFAAFFAGNPKFTATRFMACMEMAWGRLESLVKELTGFSDDKSAALVKEIAAPFVETKEKEKSPVREKVKQ